VQIIIKHTKSSTKCVLDLVVK